MDAITRGTSETVEYDYAPSEAINKPAQIGCWITFIILTCLLTGFVNSCILRLYVTQPAVRLKLPHLVVILVCCVLQVLEAAWSSGIGVHMNRLDISTLQSTFSCGGVLSAELSALMFSSMVSLLVGAVALVETLRLQSFVRMVPRIQLAVAVLLVVLSVLYGFVVIIPVFYFKYLRDRSEPCRDGSVFLILTSNRLMYIAQFIVPHCLVFMACSVLLMVYFIQRRAQQPGVYVPFGAALLPHAESGIGGDPDTATNAGNTVADQQCKTSVQTAGNNPVGTQQSSGTTIVHKDPQLPWYVLVAAAVSFVFDFVFFFRAFTSLHLPFGESTRLWAAGVLLMALKGVFLPCCWLLNKDVRGAWRCCHGPQTSGDRWSQDGETVNTTRM